jgi:hypothetical protein
MSKVFFSVLLTAATAFAQYTASPAGPPPSDLAPAISAELQKEGTKVTSSDGKTVCELWFVTKPPTQPPSNELSVSWTTVPLSSLIGVVRFPDGGVDRRGQQLKPGVYTLRFNLYPVDGAHQGVEPSRDFFVLSPASIDTDPNARPGFDELMVMSRKASGTPHPAVMSVWKADSDFKPGLSQMGDDWVLSTKVGDTPISLIVVGVNPH